MLDSRSLNEQRVRAVNMIPYSVLTYATEIVNKEKSAVHNVNQAQANIDKERAMYPDAEDMGMDDSEDKVMNDPKLKLKKAEDYVGRFTTEKQQVAEMVKALYENDDATLSEFHHAFEAQFENVERPNALEPIILNEIVKFCKFCDGKKAKPESGMLSSLISTVGSVFGSGSDKKRKLSEMQC